MAEDEKTVTEKTVTVKDSATLLLSTRADAETVSVHNAGVNPITVGGRDVEFGAEDATLVGVGVEESFSPGEGLYGVAAEGLPSDVFVSY